MRGKRCQAKVPGSIVCFVGGADVGKLLHEVDHPRNVFCGSRDLLRLLDSKGIDIFEESFDVACRVFANGLAGSGGVPDDFVIHVGDVHDVANRHSREFEETAQDIDLEEGAEVADVPVIVNGGSASVHAQRRAVRGGEHVDFSGQSIKEANRH